MAFHAGLDRRAARAARVRVLAVVLPHLRGPRSGRARPHLARPARRRPGLRRGGTALTVPATANGRPPLLPNDLKETVLPTPPAPVPDPVRASGPDTPIALVGAACRLPGGITSLDGLWTALSEGRDLVTEVPADRFDASRFLDRDPRRPGRTYTVAGGFLQEHDRFDASYFGISPREAAHMDPQQRLLLEMAVEALDDAGLDADRLAGTDTAVFVGCAGSSALALMGTVPDRTGPYTMTGGANSIVSNRLSHVFDLRGPSITVDTACSSALTAVHQACEALRTGRSRTAFAAGIGLLLDPHPYVGFAKRRCCPRPAGAGPSPPTPTGSYGRRAGHWSSSSRSPTRSPTATGCTR
ncbi:hypothetical protein CJI59_17305 [Streptomyces sp. Alain-F2R5]|nr:hypothetical protein CJI59_17305 [Streptomyces sp. Alain-F2R5]